MTFFLNSEPPEGRAGDPSNKQGMGGIPSFFRGVGAAFQSAQIENDANFRVGRETRRIAAETAVRALEILPDMGPELEARGIPLAGRSVADVVRSDRKAVATVFEHARAAADLDPRAWQDIELSDEGITNQVNARLRAEWEEAQDIIDMMPRGRGSAEFVGGMAGITTDVKNIPFLIMGSGGGSLLRIMGREAAINMGAEMAFLPSQFDVAERIDIPDPSVSQQLLMAAGAGALLGGLAEGLTRAVRYFSGRQQSQPIAGYESHDAERLVSAVEEALEQGDDPIEVLSAVPRDQDVPVTVPESVRVGIAEQALGRAGAEAHLSVIRSSPPLRFEDVTLPRASTRITPVGAFSVPPLDTRAAVESSIRYGAAREFAPEIFDALEQSEIRIASYRRWLDEFGDDQDQEVAAIIARLETRETELLDELANLRTGGRRRIRDELKKVRQARDEAVTLSGRTETPDMQRVRQALLEEQYRQRDMALDVSRAYRESAESAEQAIADLGTEFPFRQEGPQQPAAEAADTGRPTATAKPIIDDGARAQMDIFDDVTSSEARAIHDDIAADIRDQIEAEGDFSIGVENEDGSITGGILTPEGRVLRKASSILDDIEEAERFAEALNLCGAPRNVT